MRWGEELPALALATQFLTRLPITVAHSGAAMRRAPIWFPLVGAGIGIALASTLWITVTLFGVLTGALLTLACGIVLTGGLHEDGLADTADGLGGRDVAQTLEIMRDSRNGTYGVLALILSLLIRASILIGLAAADLRLAMLSLIAMQSGSRLAMLAAMVTTPYLRKQGAGADMTGLSPWPNLGIAAVPTAISVLLLPPSCWLGAIFGTLLGYGLARLSFRRLGGHTGDCLGAVQQLSEIGLGLAVVAWAR